MRTSIDTCYERCLSRWKTNIKNYIEDEYKKYADKKIAMYKWYKGINIFLQKIIKVDSTKLINDEIFNENQIIKK